MKIHEALRSYLNDPGSGLRKAGSRANYSSEIHKLDQQLDLDSFTEEDLIAAVYTPLSKGPRKGERPSDGTIYSRRKVYEGFFSYCEWNGWISKNPAFHLKRHFGGRGQPVIQHNWLTQQEVEQVLATVDMDDKQGRRDDILLRLGFTAGLRAREIGSLRWKAINFDRQEISLVGKGDKIAIVSISKNTLVRLVDWHSECAADIGGKPGDHAVMAPFINESAGIDPETGFFLPERSVRVDWDSEGISNTAIGRAVRKYSTLSGLKFAPHDMRRTFCGLLKESGLDIYQVSKAMRHSDVSTTERYIQTRPDAAAQAVREAGLDF